MLEHIEFSNNKANKRSTSLPLIFLKLFSGLQDSGLEDTQAQNLLSTFIFTILEIAFKIGQKWNK